MTPSSSTTTATADASSPEAQLDRLWSHLVAHAHLSGDASPLSSSSPGEAAHKPTAEGTTTPRRRKQRYWPGYDALWSNVRNADYDEVLRCPHDVRYPYPSSSSAVSPKTGGSSGKSLMKRVAKRSASTVVTSSSGGGAGGTTPSHAPQDSTGRLHRSASSPVIPACQGGAGTKSMCPHGVVCRVSVELFPLPQHQLHCTPDPGRRRGHRLAPPPYTGLLAPGQTLQHGLLRLSSVMKPPSGEVSTTFGRAFLRAAAGGRLGRSRLYPAAALKLFRGNGRHSGNALFSGCKVGQVSDDYFAHVQCTQLTEKVSRALKPLVKKFWDYSDYPLSLGLSDLCLYGEDGSVVPQEVEVSFPYVLVLDPIGRASAAARGGAVVADGGEGDADGSDDDDDNEGSATRSDSVDGGSSSVLGDLKKKAGSVRKGLSSMSLSGGASSGSSKSGTTRWSDGGSTADESRPFDAFLDELRSIPSGTALFDLYACPSPDPKDVSDPSRLQRIGRVVTASEMVESGPDDGLFFRHQRREEDFALRPEWKEGIKRDCSYTYGGGGGTRTGSVARIAGWRLFEGHINGGLYNDFEAKAQGLFNNDGGEGFNLP